MDCGADVASWMVEVARGSHPPHEPHLDHHARELLSPVSGCITRAIQREVKLGNFPLVAWLPIFFWYSYIDWSRGRSIEICSAHIVGHYDKVVIFTLRALI